MPGSWWGGVPGGRGPGQPSPGDLAGVGRLRASNACWGKELGLPSGRPGTRGRVSPASSGALGERPPSRLLDLGRAAGPGPQRWGRPGYRLALGSDLVALTWSPVSGPGPPVWAGPLFVDIASGPGIGQSVSASEGGGEGPPQIPTCWPVGGHRGRREAGRLWDEATSGLAGAGGHRQVPPLSSGPGGGGGGGLSRGPGPQRLSLGTWEPEAADRQATVLTNGFETCLRRPRDQPLAEGTLWAGPAVCVWVASSLLSCSLLPLQSQAVALGAVAQHEVTREGLQSNVTEGAWQPTRRHCVLGPERVALSLLLFPVLLDGPPPPSPSRWPHTWLWAVALPPGLAVLGFPHGGSAGGRSGQPPL